MIKKITSRKNEEYSFIKKLMNSSKLRRLEGLFVLEGVRGHERLLAASQKKGSQFFGDLALQTLFIDSDFLEDPDIKKFVSLAKECRELSSELMRGLSSGEKSPKLISLLSYPDLSLSQLDSFNTYILAVGMEKPGNLGALFRNLDATGVEGLILNGECADPFSPSAIRNSQGACFSVPVALASYDEVITFLEDHRISLILTSPEGSTLYTDFEYPKKVMVALGPEDKGLGEEWMQLKQAEKVYLPMKGVCDSLNVSTAGAVVLYEILRQRKSHGT